MRRSTLMGIAGLILVVIIGGGIWWQVNEWRQRTVICPDGTRITYLGATYGRKHAITEWKFQWGWPPIQRVVHRMETPFDTLYLWFRHEILPTPSGTNRYMPRAVRLHDGRIAEEEIALSRTTNINITRHGMLYIDARHFAGLVADGQKAQAEFYTETPSWGRSSLVPAHDRVPKRLTIRLPRSPLIDKITKPEPLPAVRQKEGLRVRLIGFHWNYMRFDNPWFPWENTESLLAEPRLVLEPRQGDAQEWVTTRTGFAPVGAGRPLYAVPFVSPPINVPVEVCGSWDAPVYHFAVEFKNRRTGKFLTFDFWVPPPPFEQLRRQGRIAEESRKAIAAKNYAHALQVWDHMGSEFALEASYWRGYAYAMQGDYANAIREFQKVLPHLETVHTMRDVRFGWSAVCC